MIFLSVVLWMTTVNVASACTTNLNCSLNGICTNNICKCDKPWGGKRCGVLQYKSNQSMSSSDLYPLNSTGISTPCVTPNGSCPALNTWNGPIVHVGKEYHLFNPLYKRGSLLATKYMMHGVATTITGPYTWSQMKDTQITGPYIPNPASVTYTDPITKTIKYSLWVGGNIYVSDSINGPFSNIGKGPGSNPAPIFHNNVWYATTQSSQAILTTTKLGDPWIHYADIASTARLDHGVQEDPFLYIDKRNNWHIINHAYDTTQTDHCENSILSAHMYSTNGIEWNILKHPNVEPYGHTVSYEDGSTHTYTTLERPNLHFNTDGIMTHINLAADLMTQGEGCQSYQICPAKFNGKCACTNCKYADHAGTIIIELDV